MDEDNIVTCWLCGDQGENGTMVSCGAATCGLTTPQPMKHYLIQTEFNGVTEFHSYWAYDEDHAVEQLEDSTDEYNVSQFVTHIFVSDTEILHNVIKVG